jgi:hypothetical protein
MRLIAELFGFEALELRLTTATWTASQEAQPRCDNSEMTDWNTTTYGEPCRECGYSFAISQPEALKLLLDLPRDYDAALDGATGNEQHPDLSWPVTAYVSHVADNLRIWAERLIGVATGAGLSIAAYDENVLGLARSYDKIPLGAARWSLGRSVLDIEEAAHVSAPTGPVLDHPERGELTLTEVLVAIAHDARHHLWDVERSIAVER